MMDRRPVISGNWKMNHGPEAAASFFGELGSAGGAARVIIFPPALSLPAAVEAARGTGVEIGVQNVHAEVSGAFTGENSAAAAREAGATLALIGHSERRHVFGETDDQVAAKVARAVAEGLEPVVCVGETLDERKAGRLEEVLDRQIRAALTTLPSDGAFLIAYEPVWAIGTGETATPDDAAEAHALLRDRLTEARGEVAAAVSILYGGSVKPGNAAELLAADGVDGVLVGGASLRASDFRAIIDAAER
ncbi:triose-phosphate isomerase [Gemmatimonadota bacterium DH-20]|uniref:Triosephosphate isomerase n=1 Tax=Gaopeijia maritima TaxID=3119007 RepID=A0ABU9E8L9_9BACT